MSKMYFVIRTL